MHVVDGQVLLCNSFGGDLELDTPRLPDRFRKAVMFETLLRPVGRQDLFSGLVRSTTQSRLLLSLLSRDPPRRGLMVPAES